MLKMDRLAVRRRYAFPKSFDHWQRHFHRMVVRRHLGAGSARTSQEAARHDANVKLDTEITRSGLRRGHTSAGFRCETDGYAPHDAKGFSRRIQVPHRVRM
jgi:hypothetical protein